MSKTVLIIDDEPGILGTLASILADEGYETLSTNSGQEGLEVYKNKRPDAVLLDIWLPDRDGLELLQDLRDFDPAAKVIMISGHGTVSTAVKAVKMGAHDYLEKPLSYNQVLDAVSGALEQKSTQSVEGKSSEIRLNRPEIESEIEPPPLFPIVRNGRKRQKTIKRSTVIYGLGLHSGTRTAMVLQPLPPNSGIHFFTLPAEKLIPANVLQVEDTDYATTLSRDGEKVRTVEHLLSALHAYGITNLFIKVHGEIPVLDGSSLEFCQVIEEAGVISQKVARRELVIDRKYEVGGQGKNQGEKRLTLEPHDGFHISYLLRYPAPIGEQFYEYELDSPDSYKEHIAKARTFGFMRDLKMMAELGLGSGGRLDNFILVGEDNVINTELRYPDEFVRHKILDIIGDLYLLGYPIRGKVTARLTGHRDNITILQQILRENLVDETVKI